jgi:hypothetical protein
VTSSLPSSNYQQLVVFTAAVTSSDGPPTSGTVHFLAIPTTGSSIDLGIIGIDSTGHAAVSTSILPIGVYTIQATYSGNVDFGGNSGTVGQTVAADPTTTSVISSGPTAGVGTSVTWTASVTSSYGTVNVGSVSFVALPSVGAPINLGSQSVDGTGHASVSSSTLPSNTYTIQASYSGTADFGASTGTTNQVVQFNTATITVTDSPTSFNSLYTSGLTLQATVAGSGPTPTGTVTFYIGPSSGWPGDAGPIAGGSNINVVAGVATVSVSSVGLALGTYMISCSYSGDANYAAVAYTVPTTATLSVVDPFNIVTSANATTSSNTLTDNTVNFLAGGEYSVQTGDQLIMKSTGNVYQINSVTATTLTVTGVSGGITGGSFAVADTGSNLSYSIQSSNVTPPQYWHIASGGGTVPWTVDVQQGAGNAPAPTGTLTFFYFDANITGKYVQLGLINGVTNSGGLIEIATATQHGLVTNQQVVISGVNGVPANGTWTVTKVDSLHFTLNGSTFSGGYISGGTTAFPMSSGSAVYTIDKSGFNP